VKVYRKSHDAVDALRIIERAIAGLLELTEEGEGPLEYCGWRHRTRDAATDLAMCLKDLIAEAANDEEDLLADLDRP
jgi:hypothetical protein